MQYPLLTVAVISYNQWRFIFENINSVLNQNYPNLELVVSDDCSDDFIAEDLSAYIEANKSENLRNYVISHSEERLGTVRNANKAFSLSRGEYVKLLAADDCLFDSGVVSAYVSVFEENNANMVSGRCFVYDNIGTYVKQYPSFNDFKLIADGTPKEIFNACALTNVIHSPGVALRKSYYEKMGQFDEKYFLIEDWPMWLKILRSREKIYTVNTPVVRYRMGGVSNSTNENHKQYAKKCWEEYFPIYQNEILAYPEMLTKQTKRKLKRCRKMLKFLFIRDYEYNQYSKSKRLVYQSALIWFCLCMAFKDYSKTMLMQLEIKAVINSLVWALTLFVGSSIAYATLPGDMFLFASVLLILGWAFLGLAGVLMLLWTGLKFYFALNTIKSLS